MSALFAGQRVPPERRQDWIWAAPLLTLYAGAPPPFIPVLEMLQRAVPTDAVRVQGWSQAATSLLLSLRPFAQTNWPSREGAVTFEVGRIQWDAQSLLQSTLAQARHGEWIIKARRRGKR